MAVNYSSMLIAACIFISVFGAFAGLTFQRLTSTISNSAEKTALEFVAAAAYGGIGLWSTHFIGMLALAGDDLKYDSSFTLLSLGFAVFFSFAGFKVSSSKAPKILSALGAAVLLMLAALTMFLSAMKATSVSALFAYNTAQLTLAILASIALSGVGIFFLISRLGSRSLILSTIFLAAAISCVHFLAIDATTITPRQNLGFLSTIGSLDLASVTAMLLLVNISLIGIMAFIFANFYHYPRLENETDVIDIGHPAV